ncbi:MAG: hypothetical protein KJZ93_26145 [Caldilineaceae bacterium]|nr:hypothetical protein [Caldilineaceae bacterium]RIK32172.1 MAG: hypothetical protein DCC55_36440 [Chloroflexota bacterium]
MFFKKNNPPQEFLALVISFVAQAASRPMSQSLADSCAQALLNGDADRCEGHLGEFILAPLAYEMVRHWEGCGRGTCANFTYRMMPFGWPSLAPITLLLTRPPALAEAHFRLWEQTLRPEGIIAQGIRREFENAEKYLLHMLLHATTDTVYRLSEGGPFISTHERAAHVPFQAKALLRQTLGIASRLSGSDYFVSKEVDGLQRCAQELI